MVLYIYYKYIPLISRVTLKLSEKDYSAYFGQHIDYMKYTTSQEFVRFQLIKDEMSVEHSKFIRKSCF